MKKSFNRLFAGIAILLLIMGYISIALLPIASAKGLDGNYDEDDMMMIASSMFFATCNNGEKYVIVTPDDVWTAFQTAGNNVGDIPKPLSFTTNIGASGYGMVANNDLAKILTSHCDDAKPISPIKIGDTTYDITFKVNNSIADEYLSAGDSQDTTTDTQQGSTDTETYPFKDSEWVKMVNNIKGDESDQIKEQINKSIFGKIGFTISPATAGYLMALVIAVSIIGEMIKQAQTQQLTPAHFLKIIVAATGQYLKVAILGMFILYLVNNRGSFNGGLAVHFMTEIAWQMATMFTLWALNASWAIIANFIAKIASVAAFILFAWIYYKVIKIIAYVYVANFFVIAKLMVISVIYPLVEFRFVPTLSGYVTRLIDTSIQSFFSYSITLALLASITTTLVTKTAGNVNPVFFAFLFMGVIGVISEILANQVKNLSTF